jgi:MFS family permease
LLGSIRVKEPAPPLKADREPVVREIAAGLRLVVNNRILRATTLASMATAAMWGIGGALWFLFAIEELGLDPAAIGIVAAVGGLSSLFGALLTTRATARFGAGKVVVGGVLFTGLGSLFVPLAPVGAPLIAMAFLIGNQLVTDPAATAYDITDTSIRQSIVHDRSLGRVNATITVAVLVAQLIATLAAGFLALEIGLRNALFLQPVVALLGVLFVVFSPVRKIQRIEDLAPAGAEAN